MLYRVANLFARLLARELAKLPSQEKHPPLYQVDWHLRLRDPEELDYRPAAATADTPLIWHKTTSEYILPTEYVRVVGLLGGGVAEGLRPSRVRVQAGTPCLVAEITWDREGEVTLAGMLDRLREQGWAPLLHPGEADVQHLVAEKFYQ